MPIHLHPLFLCQSIPLPLDFLYLSPPCPHLHPLRRYFLLHTILHMFLPYDLAFTLHLTPAIHHYCKKTFSRFLFIPPLPTIFVLILSLLRTFHTELIIGRSLIRSDNLLTAALSQPSAPTRSGLAPLCSHRLETFMSPLVFYTSIIILSAYFYFYFLIYQHLYCALHLTLSLD